MSGSKLTLQLCGLFEQGVDGLAGLLLDIKALPQQRNINGLPLGLHLGLDLNQLLCGRCDR